MFELKTLLGSWEGLFILFYFILFIFLELFILEKSENTHGEKEHKTTYNPILENHC